jgi:glutathionylspermidine synthase
MIEMATSSLHHRASDGYGNDVEGRLSSAPYRCGRQLDAEVFAKVRRSLVLEHCKWDPQVGDVGTLADFPLIMPRHTWIQLARWSEALTAEAVVAECEIAARVELHRRLGLPRRLRDALKPRRGEAWDCRAPRAMRYDFHLTRGGWRISECNADVPGGYAEASAFTAMMARHCPGAVPPGDPGAAWANAIARTADSADVALLSAPGFIEDHEVISYLAKRLVQMGVQAHCSQPNQIQWIDGVAFLGGRRLGAVVRFYQSEWLANLPRSTQWWNYFRGSRTPILNPGTCVSVESKRFPLVWDDLSSTGLATWRQLLPACADPREVPWRNDDTWLLKTSLCNTGDTVSVRSLMTPARWANVERSARWFPGEWIAQRRFEPLPLATPLGEAYPCIGVYTIDGRVCGAYTRLSYRPIVDYAAVDVALLIEESNHAADA